MTDDDAADYGDRIADVYDELYSALPGLTETVDLLTELADGGPVLELGIGTGRVALPLAERGLAVHGIDASAAMIAKLRAKSGGDRIPVTLGDFADVNVADRYALVFVLANTFFALPTQERQVVCFANVAARLGIGGRFVIEAFVPDPGLYHRGQGWSVPRVEADWVSLGVHHHDPVSQRVRSQTVILREEGTRLYPVTIRYAWPAELDLMARLAGLSLEHRWGGWGREPFTADSRRHISVYRGPS